MAKRTTRFQYIPVQADLEATIAEAIQKTGQVEIRDRRKRGQSAFILKGNAFVEQKANKTEVHIKSIDSKWISIDKDKRIVSLK